MGTSRIIWNLLMGFAALAATAAGISAIYKKGSEMGDYGGEIGLGVAGVFVALVLIVQILHKLASESSA